MKNTFKCQSKDGDELSVRKRVSGPRGGSTIRANGKIVGILSEKQALRMAALLTSNAEENAPDRMGQALAVSDTYGDILKVAKADGEKKVAVWSMLHSNVSFHFSLSQAKELIAAVNQIILEVENNG
jgi:siroheme synthase (precorrin-2 oxidase/ferrochelatase)